MSKTILIGKNGSLPVKVKAKNKKNSTSYKLEGKTVVFRISAKGTTIAGVVKSVEGGQATVSLALPTYEGILVASKDATLQIPVEDLSVLDAITITDRDVKSWQSNEPVTSRKASEIKDDNGRIIDYTDVTFEGFGSTFQSTTPEDRDGDYVMDGAFKNLAEFRENPVMLTDHTRRVINLMGSYSKVQPNKTGLAVKGDLTNSMHPDAVHTRALVAEGHLRTLSIGGAFFYADDYRGIEQIILHEISLVVIPANPDAKVQVRSLSASFAEKAFEGHAKSHGGEVRFKA